MTSEQGEKNTTVGFGATEPEDVKPESDGRVVGGWASNEQIYVYDRAALEEGLSRAKWIVRACDERARQVLAAKSVLESKSA